MWRLQPAQKTRNAVSLKALSACGKGDLSLLVGDKEGGFAVMPKGLFRQKASKAMKKKNIVPKSLSLGKSPAALLWTSFFRAVICVGFCKAASGARRTCPLIRHSSLGGLGDAASADVGIQCLENKEFTNGHEDEIRLTRMGKEHLNLPVLVGLLWMASSTEGSDTVLLYPTIMMPRNITMGFGTFVNFRCELNITAGSASEVFWLLGGARIPNDHRRHSKLEVPAEGRYVSHLEVRDLQAVDAGRYTCDATARLNNLNLVLVIPDSVYLSVAGTY
ncbi:hypothetical protein V5799_012034 [Amblyomma americanum]|uniref:Ig-like domain-containing protein n=1 Tax=Amblyomma americanum TaxID=6943 RepID=A0AAQ4EFJ1_AMBAM